MYKLALLLVKSATCTVWLWLHGFHVAAVTCEGRLPVVHGGGTVVIRGRLAMRCRIAPCELGATRGGTLEIGERVFINQGATIVASDRIEIGSDSRIGDFTAIYDSNYHAVDASYPTRRAPVTIGTNVWLGRNVTVLPGTTIGDHSVIGAGSVVVSEIPARVLASGNPARIVRELNVPDGWRRG